VWLLLHGNAGQAGDRVYALPSFLREDSVFIMEYPGYGMRPGSPSMAAFNAAAEQAYELLKARFPGRPVSVAGESIGSGPASVLARHRPPPDKIVLIVPFDVLSRVARHHVPFVPAELLLRDNWNNIEALRGYRGPVDIFGARDDTIIPVAHARALAASVPSARLHELEGGHNDWAEPGRVRLSYP
jgi:pimeloyl-ACP methyl ester carboxylesterase